MTLSEFIHELVTRDHTMTHHDDASTFADVLARFGDDGTKDLFRRLLEQALQGLIDAELTAQIGASRHERTDSRSNYRNGNRDRDLSTPAGDVELRIPKLRAGSFFPSLLEPRRRVDKALWAVIMTAYITGTSTRKVDDLVKALGCDTGVSKSTVSRICSEIDEQVAVFRTRALDHQGFPYVYLDATYVKARVDHHIVSRAVVIATGVAADGNREVLGIDVGDSEDEVFWTSFLADTIDSRYRTLVLTAGFTGARFGELASLQPRDLDLERRRVTITRSLAEVRGLITETEPKTSASRRSITLPQPVVDALDAHLNQHGTEPTGHVFTAPEGGPLRRRSFRKRFWLPAVDASVGQPMRFHDLRHTHAALLIAANTHPKLLQSRLGHTSIKTTLDIYGHLYEPLDEIAADRLEKLIADAIAHRTRAERGLEL